MPIDHEDEREEHCRELREHVFARVGARGTAIASPQQMVAEWVVRFVGFRGEKQEPAYSIRLESSGHAVLEYPERPPSPEDKWRVNSDGSFSLIFWCPPMPEYGIEEPQLDEMRKHAAVLPDGCVLMWNDDASVVEQWSPRQGRPGD